MSNKTTQKNKSKEPVRLREKTLANGSKSLYLDIYTNGHREYEFLKLYIVKERTTADKLQNKETLRQAQMIKAQRIIDLNNANNGLSIVRQKSKVNFIDYCNKVAEYKKEKANGNERGTYSVYKALIYHLEKYSGIKTLFKQIDKKYCEGFISYLKTAESKRNGGTIKPNSQVNYLKTFDAILNTALQDGIMTINPMRFIKSDDKPKREETSVCFLTMQELKKLNETPCRKPQVKKAFLFSCYTGLRYSDVVALTWDNIQEYNDTLYIVFSQKKSPKLQYLPLNETAQKQLPERSDNASDTDHVFDIPNGGYTNVFIREWTAMAGIKKQVTFHVARHTHATLLLAKGVKAETIQEILGHSSIQLTLSTYAKVMDETVFNAVNQLENL